MTEVKYNIPIEVTKEKLDYLKVRFPMQVAWRTDSEGKHWIKLWDMSARKRFEHELNK